MTDQTDKALARAVEGFLSIYRGKYFAGIKFGIRPNAPLRSDVAKLASAFAAWNARAAAPEAGTPCEGHGALKFDPDAREDEAFILLYSDKDVPYELFSGNGARGAAWARYHNQLSAWTCHLFKMVQGIPRDHARFAAPEPDGAREAWQELVERDGRTSPADYPEMALITEQELSAFIATARAVGYAAGLAEARAACIEAASICGMVQNNAARDGADSCIKAIDALVRGEKP
ncbi:hypothetical protein ACELLULO517_07475 [Acidisoma cellulosilytica]|uniref:Uncharacterized protein n=1 Tax=Acidisoma cellulosilyticum TaxID=2802395 RepID=A0A963Z1D9_9PROT|nr:hypothetical protein [Acidisoma cellulosilyticum]MCB8880070.1 hypothetical protein [Acidisoma cellulosilyticum]